MMVMHTLRYPGSRFREITRWLLQVYISLSFRMLQQVNLLKVNLSLFINIRNSKPMNNWEKYLILLFVICFYSATTYSQKVGTTSMQFLKVMPCARATALGDAYSVLASGAEAAFWNPSGIAQVQNQELSSTYMMWMMDTKIGALSFSSTLNNFGAFGVSLQYVDYGEMEEAIWNRPYSKNDPYPGLTGRTFHPFAYVAGITYAINLTDKFSTGFSVKYAYESLYDGNLFN